MPVQDALLALLALAVTAQGGQASPNSTAAGQRSLLTASQLTSGWTYPAPVALVAYGPGAGTQDAGARFEGRLSLRSRAADAHLRVLRDDYRVAQSDDTPLRRLPDLDLDFVQSGDVLLRERVGPLPSSHPYWEYVVGTGRVWREPGDQGWSRASIPFALVEVNANCVHNGVLTFLFRADGRTSRAAYQVSSETCAYFQADLWGLLDASYAPGRVAEREELLRTWQREMAGRLPRKPIAELATAYPAVNVAGFAHPDDVRELTTWGVVADGIHYAGGCPTRAGEYPYCDQVLLPSYSVAKSVFAALALMRLEKLWPGTRLERVADHVPQCRASGGWTDVTLEDLLDMASGHYLSADEHVDESAAHADERFFMRETHAEKIDYACNYFPRRSEPGKQFVYHTSDTYLLGTAMSDVLRRERGADSDLVRELAWPEVWREIGVGAGVSAVRRTRDASAQPFTGYGLLFEPGDVARLAQFFEAGNPLPGQLLDAAMYRAALQRDPGDRGLAVPGDSALVYQHGFWALRVAGLPGCAGETYVPFMSGYGGITVALMPNDVAYYYFSDGRDFRFLRAVREAANIHPYCAGRAPAPHPAEELQR